MRPRPILAFFFSGTLSSFLAVSTSALPLVGTEAFADFSTDGDAKPFTLTFTERDFGGANTAGDWTVANDVANYANNNGFNDVATALVQTTVVDNFSLSVDIASNSLDFDIPRIGLVALATNPSESNGNFNGAGIYAYVESNGSTNGNVTVNGNGETVGGYDFNIASNGVILATSALFDITSFDRADFTITLDGVFDSSGGLTVTAVLDSNRSDVSVNDLTLTTNILSGALPGGENFGLRINNQQGSFELDVDNLSVVVPEPGSLALAAAGLGLVLSRRRR